MSCELCDALKDDIPLWEDDIIFIAQKGRIILKEHKDDCTDSEWNHILEVMKKLFKKKQAYKGHKSEHFHIDVIQYKKD